MSEGELAHEVELENERKGPRRDFTPGEMRGGSILGHPVRRVEDPRFLTGQAQYTEDLPADQALHAVFVRSTMAHARITGIDSSEAAGMPGVVGVFAAADLDLAPNEPEGGAGEAFARPILATGTVRFVGEPIAVVLAETRAQAVDAAETVLVDYDPLPVVVDPLAALQDGAPLLFPDAGIERGSQSRLSPRRGRPGGCRGRRDGAHRQPASGAGADGAERHPRGSGSGDRRADRLGPVSSAASG